MRNPEHPRHYLYQLWYAIRNKCHNCNMPNYHKYGGRGIKMHEEWRDDREQFIFWIIDNLGERPSIGHSLDRKNNDGHYEPGNLQWSTQFGQQNNRRGLKTSEDRHIYNNNGQFKVVIANKYYGSFDTKIHAMQMRDHFLRQLGITYDRTNTRR